MRIWRKLHPKRVRHQGLDSPYRRLGLGGKQGYITRYEQQEGRCAICKRKKPKFGHDGLNADHNHKTNQPRGLVCHRCNMLIGSYETAFDLWAKVEEYLKYYETTSLCQQQGI